MREVEELTAQLAVRAQEIEEAKRRTDQFLAMLAHELRNPIATLTLAVEELDPTRPPVEIILRQLSYLRRMVDDLLDVSRVTQSKVVLAPESLDLCGFVRASVGARLSIVRGAGHTVDVALPEGRLWVRADPTRLEQILGNLIDNAVKYTPPPGIIEVSVELEGQWVELRVSDDGRGLDPDQLGSVFEIFVQHDEALHRDRAGLGIGLTMVRELVQLHGGDVSAESPGLGQGSTFRVRFPAAEPPEDELLARPITPHVDMMDPPRIMLVEDNEDLRILLVGRLRRRDFSVEEFDTARDALARLEEGGALPRAIVTDVGLPGMSGYEFAHAVRANPELAAIRLVALTGYGSRVERREALYAGFDEHLVKPVTIDSLIAAIGMSSRAVE